MVHEGALVKGGGVRCVMILLDGMQMGLIMGLLDDKQLANGQYWGYWTTSK